MLFLLEFGLFAFLLIDFHCYSSSKCVFAWNLETEEEVDIASICSHKYAVNSVAYCAQTDTIASASTDGTLNLFNLQVCTKSIVQLA